MKTVEFLDAIKRVHGIEKDTDVAPLLGVKRAAVSNYRRGIGFFEDDVAVKAAALLNVPAGYVMACVHAERAARAKQEDVRNAWERTARALKGMAAAIVLAVSLIVTTTLVPSPTEAGTQNASRALYIMSNKERLPYI